LPPACALARALREHLRRFTVDHHLHVVHGNVGPVLRIDAARIRRAVLLRVPAAQREIHAAAERDLVVDHDGLLVVRGAERQMTVEQDVDAARLPPAEHPLREELALRGVEHGVIPQQDADAELPAPAQQPTQQLAELDRRAIRSRARADQLRAAVDFPAEDVDRALGFQQGRAQRAEMVGRVDERRRARRLRATPAGIAFDQQRRLRALPRRRLAGQRLAVAPRRTVDRACLGVRMRPLGGNRTKSTRRRLSFGVGATGPFGL
jgi:hypothetical protein